MFRKKIYAYENSEGDKGVIIARSMKAAVRLFHIKYPDRQIADNDDDYWRSGAYLFEVGYASGNKLYDAFLW